MPILCLGPSGSGKSLLLKRIQAVLEATSFFEKECHPSTISTIGTKILTVPIAKRTDITVQEIGGVMAPIWQDYYADAFATMFVIDSCQRFQLSCAGILLMDVLSNKKLTATKFALVLNKKDVSTGHGCLTLQEINAYLDLNNIILNSPRDLTVIQTSAVSGEGIDDLIAWICEASLSQKT